ncbi:MAG: hypothetical protein JRF56_20725 [Deltaproteobacteria bacterium]|jgi:hypothetical protein|nr:hypothetical protein [Deltaproteobacteria bacterium]
MVILLSGFALFDVAAAQSSAELEGQALAAALRKGGYNIYFRHAAIDWSQNDRVLKECHWASCDSGRMRQLSDAADRPPAPAGMRCVR